MAKEKKAKKKADKAAEGDAPKAKSGIVGKILTPLLIFGAAFGANMLLPAAAPTVIVAEGDHHDPADKKKSGTYVPASPSKTVAINPLITSIGGDGRTLRLGVAVQLMDGDLDPADPRLRDAFMGYLRAVDAESLNHPGFHAELKRQLTHRARVSLADTLGPDAVFGLLITDFYIGTK